MRSQNKLPPKVIAISPQCNEKGISDHGTLRVQSTPGEERRLDKYVLTSSMIGSSNPTYCERIVRRISKEPKPGLDEVGPSVSEYKWKRTVGLINLVNENQEEVSGTSVTESSPSDEQDSRVLIRLPDLRMTYRINMILYNLTEQDALNATGQCFKPCHFRHPCLATCIIRWLI